jgi:hypothetical protein
MTTKSKNADIETCDGKSEASGDWYQVYYHNNKGKTGVAGP